ncbi:MAG TPA: hypothetical protein VG815_08680, partial [Chloroflexota bacterium]|nr:hypothetical protein [Chloroflexota bacterium]
ARAIEPLNSVAVSGSVKAPHDAAARMASFGTAGLYQPVRTGGDQLEASTAVWFSKPDGMSYDAMYARLESSGPEVQDRLWQRMMTLGPTPEFCLLGGGPDFLPYGWTNTMVVRRRVRV